MNKLQIQEQQKKYFLFTILIAASLIAIFYSFYLWYLVPTEQYVDLDGVTEKVELDDFLGSILDPNGW